MGTQGAPPQPTADSMWPAGGKVGRHLWNNTRKPPRYLCAPTTNGEGRHKGISQWEMGYPALRSLPRQ